MKSYTAKKIKYGDLKLLILQPTVNAKPKEKTPGILWLHGGGYAVGMASMIYISRAIELVKKYGAVVITPEYRLAGKAPYPAALEDCYAALKYLKDHADELGCNRNQIMVGGESAGGGLTAALCMYARDKGEVNIAFQMPLYPMADNQDTDSSRNNRGITWNTRRNHAAWKLYLRNVTGEVPAYAAPARQTDYRNLPPAYTFVGNRETFYCETMTFIENLHKAGVSAKVDVYPSGFHAFDMLTPFRKISRQAIREFEKQYLYAAEHYFAPQEDANMKEECLICKAPLEYLVQDEMMECVICHKQELSKTRCVEGHYVCSECHTEGMDSIFGLCLSETSTDPIEIIRKMMDMPFCHMHGPEHHVMVGAALLTAYKNAGGELDLGEALKEMYSRGKQVPGGSCGFWGACGAGVSAGQFMAIATQSTPLAVEPWGLSNQMTAKALDSIGKVGGPRCCKRDSYLAMLAAIDFAKEHLGVEMTRRVPVCTHNKQNNQCIGKRCPFLEVNHEKV